MGDGKSGRGVGRGGMLRVDFYLKQVFDDVSDHTLASGCRQDKSDGIFDSGMGIGWTGGIAAEPDGCQVVQVVAHIEGARKVDSLFCGQLGQRLGFVSTALDRGHFEFSCPLGDDRVGLGGKNEQLEPALPQNIETKAVSPRTAHHFASILIDPDAVVSEDAVEVDYYTIERVSDIHARWFHIPDDGVGRVWG